MEIDHFDSFVEDFLSEKLERPMIIVGASKIDELLLLILSKFLVSPIDSKNDELLRGDNPLSTFSSRIKSCYRLGIIDRKLYKILDTVRKVRNLCAHRIEFDIKSSPIREHILELKKDISPRETFILTKKRYFSNNASSNTDELHCLLVTICVILEAIHMKITKTEGLKETLQISSK